MIEETEFIDQNEHILKPWFNNDCFKPNVQRSIWKALPTALTYLGVEVEREDTFMEENYCRRIIEQSGLDEVENLIFMVIDSLGTLPFLKFSKFMKENSFGFPISSIFPTITSSAIVSIETALPPEVHGIMGHKIFLDEIGTVVNTLRMATYQANWRDSLVRVGVNARSLMWAEKKYNLEDVKEVFMLHEEIATTGLSHFFMDKNKVLPYSNLIDAFSLIRRLLEKYDGEKIFLNFYLDTLDTLSHRYGPDSIEVKIAVELIEKFLKDTISNIEKNIGKKTVIFIVSDHGQTSVNPDKNITVTREEVDELKELMRGDIGKSGRTLHFYAKEDKVDELYEHLTNSFHESGYVLPFNAFSELFQGNRVENVKKRLGDILVVLKPGFNVKFKKDSEEEEVIIERSFLGQHGGLTFEELSSCFLILPLST
ncbi:MAG: alkaline phosphatase family protein [Candidatus Odinarchaeia archaeon]